jgi:hypothetical protein
MQRFEVGDLVKDSLNEGDGCYGLGVIVTTDSTNMLGQEPNTSLHPTDLDIPGKKYDVYFTQFERIITFHGDYLEKV